MAVIKGNLLTWAMKDHINRMNAKEAYSTYSSLYLDEWPYELGHAPKAWAKAPRQYQTKIARALLPTRMDMKQNLMAELEMRIGYLEIQRADEMATLKNLKSH